MASPLSFGSRNSLKLLVSFLSSKYFVNQTKKYTKPIQSYSFLFYFSYVIMLSNFSIIFCSCCKKIVYMGITVLFNIHVILFTVLLLVFKLVAAASLIHYVWLASVVPTGSCWVSAAELLGEVSGILYFLKIKVGQLNYSTKCQDFVKWSLPSSGPTITKNLGKTNGFSQQEVLRGFTLEWVQEVFQIFIFVTYSTDERSFSVLSLL